MPLPEIRARDLLWLGVTAIVLWALYSLAPVLMPFFLAWIFAYIWQPVVTWLDGRRVPRALSVVLVLVLEALVLALLVLTVMPLLFQEIAKLSRELPALLDRANATVVPWIAERTGLSVALDSASLRDWLIEALKNNEGVTGQVLNSLRLGGLGLLGLFAVLVLVPVVQFYLMRDWELITRRLDALIPRGWYEPVTQFVAEADEALGQYLHGQVLVILVMALFYTVGLYLTGLEFFLPIGIITGVLVFVPYVGAATGFVLATLSAVMQFSGWVGLAWVWVVFFLGQAIEGNFVTPKLVGDRIGLHPVAVILALLVFGQLFGFPGLLLALPVSAVLLVALRKLKGMYLVSRFYNNP